ncbi:Uma2 family endonuclease [[Limnothrix rosea] IAM M-220]|uniref:Uma2 family endonuclease n=1 Tax=[Limnothrix rosea] IAM M-220 TaxID=454133 RepID=UPI000960D465|nr:Uma2 family endonuclease [[Limnothrix rosea] IAM M-220]OKH11064.1 hypothetical protein NIES208_17815 [[Limnothrix rosea] IAM M-220]
MVQLQSNSYTAPTRQPPKVEWIRLPEDYPIPDDPVESILQPFLAAALTESLDLAGLVQPEIMIASNMAIAVRIDGKTVLKAPDWFFVSQAAPLPDMEIRRRYTPHRDGKVPEIVMEFLSEEDTAEYSIRPAFPYGKMWFYERILQAPIYVIFDPATANLEVRQLNTEGIYEKQEPNQAGRYFLEPLNLELGIWQGKRLEQEAFWLRWWQPDGELLLWGAEKIALEQQRLEQERQRADQAEDKLIKLKRFLTEQGLEIPE